MTHQMNYYAIDLRSCYSAPYGYFISFHSLSGGWPTYNSHSIRVMIWNKNGMKRVIYGCARVNLWRTLNYSVVWQATAVCRLEPPTCVPHENKWVAVGVVCVGLGGRVRAINRIRMRCCICFESIFLANSKTKYEINISFAFDTNPIVE